MLIDLTVDRLKTLDALGDRVEEAAELAELVRKGALPNTTPHAYVLPLGLRPRDRGEAGAGAFTQEVDEIVGIVLVVRATGDTTGKRALPKIQELITSTLALIAGWAPDDDDMIGNFYLVSGTLLSANAGVVIYQLDFGIQTQLRNLT